MSADSSKSMIMELATNSVRNTTLATENDDPYYEVVTRFWHPNLTKINKLDPASRKMTTVCEIDNAETEAKVRFAVDNEKGKSPKDSLGPWVSSDAILKLAPKKPLGACFIFRAATELIFDNE